MRALLVSALLLAPAALLAQPKDNKKAPEKGPGPGQPTVQSLIGKTPPTCGVKILPLVVGNEWTYSQVAAPAPAPEGIQRIAPPQPQTIHVEVKAVDKKGNDTVVTLEEKVSTNISHDEKKPNVVERTLTTTITCNKDKLEVSPESVFFAGEPGGFVGMTIDKIDRKNAPSFKINPTTGLLADDKWEEDVAMQWSRHETPGSEAKLGSGKIELERVWQPSQTEIISSKLTTFRAEKVGLTTTGRVTLDGAAPDSKPSELPENWIALFWFTEGIGVTQMLNPYAHMYQLTDVKLH